MKHIAGLLVGILLFAVLLTPANVSAHAALLSADPAPNAFLQAAPGEIVLRFTEPVSTRSSGVRVLDARGVQLVTQPAEISGTTIRLALPPLAPGIYNVLWYNVSTVDGHALRGSHPFTVLNPDGSVPDTVNTVGSIGGEIDPPPRAEGVAVRALSLLGLIIASAGAALGLLLPASTAASHRVHLTRATFLGAGVMLLATVLHLEVIRVEFANVGIFEIVSSTRIGGYWLTRLGAVILILFAAWLAPEMPRRAAGGAIIAVAVYLFGYAATSHAAAGTGSIWGTAIDFVHGVGAVLWIGAVTGVAILARSAGRSVPYAALMARFGTTASVLVFLLLGTGLLSSFIEVPEPGQLVETRYGLILLTKMLLVLPLLGIAGYNARWGRRRLEALAPGEPRRFLLTVTAEIAIGVAVFALAAMLTQTSVAKSIARPQESRPFAQTVRAADLQVGLAVDPNRTGLNTYGVTVTSSAGQPVEADRVRLTFRYQEDQTLGDSSLTLARSTPGVFTGQGPFLTLEGQWRVQVEVRRPNADDANAFFDVRPSGTPVNLQTRGSAWDNPAPGLSWNQFGGIALLLAGLGLALWRDNLGSLTRVAGWTANAGTLVCFGFGAVLLFGVHNDAPPGTIPRNSITADQNSIDTGRTLYQRNCVTCHGQTGVPPAGLDLKPYPLDLTVHVPQHSDGQIFLFIANGVPGTAMPAWSEGPNALTDDEIWHLVNYLRTLKMVEN